MRADEVTGLDPAAAWTRLSCGDGSMGRRWYSWAVLELEPEHDGPDQGSGHHALLMRRNDTTGELAWSRWRRRHQHRARRAHYKRREGTITAAHRPDLRLWY
jgi:hypothetical protein